MMKKLLIALLALGTLSVVPSAQAQPRARSNSNNGKCSKCHQHVRNCKCHSQCDVQVSERQYTKPCKKMVEVTGETPWVERTTTKTCTKVTNHCLGGCKGGCPTGATAADQGDDNN